MRWLTLQFIAPTRLGARLDLVVERLVGGSLAQLALTGRADGEIMFHGMAAAGSRGGAPAMQAAATPDAPGPASCPIVRAHDRAEHDVHQLVEIRLARGRFGVFSKAERSADGHVLVWMRPRSGPVDAAMLGLMADFVGSIVSDAVGLRGGAGSLDNTFRIVRLAAIGWVLCDLAIDAIAGGVGHGRVELFAEDGTLLATGSQTFIARLYPVQAQARRERRSPHHPLRARRGGRDDHAQSAGAAERNRHRDGRAARPRLR